MKGMGVGVRSGEDRRREGCRDGVSVWPSRCCEKEGLMGREEN